MEGTDIGGTVAEETNGDLAGFAVLSRPCGAGCDRHVGTDDRVRSHNAVLDAHQVHRTTLATQQATFTTHQFAEDAAHRDTSNQCVVVSAIGTKRVIVFTHGRAESCSDGLLAQCQV